MALTKVKYLGSPQGTLSNKGNKVRINLLNNVPSAPNLAHRDLYSIRAKERLFINCQISNIYYISLAETGSLV